MLTSSGPANISGNKVSTSIFMLDRRSSESSARRPVLDNLQGAAHAFAGAAGSQERANRIDGHPLPADHPSHVTRAEAQFINGQAVALHWSDRHLVRMFHESLDHEFQESLHK